jgi:hypothetical protein
MLPGQTAARPPRRFRVYAAFAHFYAPATVRRDDFDFLIFLAIRVLPHAATFSAAALDGHTTILDLVGPHLSHVYV